MNVFYYLKGRPAGLFIMAVTLVSFVQQGQAQSTPTDKANRLFRSLTGVKPSSAILTQMASMISSGDALGAAATATQNRYFLENTIRTWSAPWMSVEGGTNLSLNDGIATVMGLVRDNSDFRQVLSGDVIYTGTGLTNAYTPTPNGSRDHFQELEALETPVGDSLQRQVQSVVNGYNDTAGIMTTQTWGLSFFDAGTNRRPFQQLMKSFWCEEMDSLRDTSLPDMYVRQDVPRVVSGDPTIFLNKCKGCHAFMDPLTKAFAYFDYDDNGDAGGLMYTPAQVQNKMVRQDDVYPDGYRTQDDQWINVMGDSASQGFAPYAWPQDQLAGSGASALGKAIAESRGFSVCMAKQVFTKVCSKEGETFQFRLQLGSHQNWFDLQEELLPHPEARCYRHSRRHPTHQ